MKATVAGVGVHKVDGEWEQAEVAVGDEWPDDSSMVRGNPHLFEPVKSTPSKGGDA